MTYKLAEAPHWLPAVQAGLVGGNRYDRTHPNKESTKIDSKGSARWRMWIVVALLTQDAGRDAREHAHGTGSVHRENEMGSLSRPGLCPTERQLPYSIDERCLKERSSATCQPTEREGVSDSRAARPTFLSSLRR